LEKGQLADLTIGHTVIASLKPLGQLETTLVGMFIGWSSETVMFLLLLLFGKVQKKQ
jgi:hypothetical protein